MAWEPFYKKLLDDEKQNTSEKKEDTNSSGNLISPWNKGDGSEKVTDLNEVTVTAPKKEAPAGDDGSDFTVSEEQPGEPFKESPDFEVKEGMHNKIYDTQPSDTPATPAATTPAAAPAAESAGTTAGADRVPNLPVEVLGKYHQQQEEEEEYLKAHPWVAESDLSVLYDKYKDKTPAQMIYDISQYRNKHGQRLSEEELALLLAGRDPNRSKKEVTKEKRRAYWADMINEIGNVLAHFYNYGRAKAGSPAATITPNKSDNVARLRAADMAMRQRGYNDYVNAMANAEKRRVAREDLDYKLKLQEAQEKRRLENQKALKEHEWLSPKYKLELERLTKDLNNRDIQIELNKAKLAYQKLVNEGKTDEQALEITYKKLRNALANKKLNEDDGKKYKVGGQSFADAYTAYNRGVVIYNKEHPNDIKRIVERTKFNKRPNEYLKEVGVDF